jgi:holo-[acyl-carrier protein] synthase
MTYGFGIDIVEITRIEKEFVTSPDLVRQLFTEQEICSCQSRKKPILWFAAHLAVKEALLKALGIGLREGLRFREIEIINNIAEAPTVQLHGRLDDMFGKNMAAHCHVSFAFTGHLACAVVALEQKGM